MGEEPEEMGIPEWVVTFGDMMSLLLTFFIMLVSLSEIKEEEKFQAMVDSMQREFGFDKTIDALAPGESKPRSSEMRVLSTTGRAKKKDTAKGGVDEKAPVGENRHVQSIRPGQATTVGATVFFPLASDVLDQTAKHILSQAAVQLKGKPQKIEIRGHTSLAFATRTRGTGEAMGLGYRRAMAVYQYLVDVEQMPENRFRVSSAGGAEPSHNSSGGSSSARNPRVEVSLLDETVEDLRSDSNELTTESSPNNHTMEI